MKPRIQLPAAVGLALWLLPAFSHAQFTFTTNNGVLTLTSYTGSDRAVSIPATTNGLAVVGIATYAFYYNSNLSSAMVPAGVTNISHYAFYNCSNLTAVYFQGNAPVDYYPGAAPIFQGAKRATLYYLEGTTGWTNSFDLLPTVQWDPLVLNQLLFTSNDSVITITGYVGPTGPVVIPSTLNGFPVIAVASNAFLNSRGLTGITLPNTITNLGSLAFAGCTGLTSFAVPPGSVGSGVLSNCTALTKIVLHTNLAIVGDSEFSGCTSLAAITIPANVGYIAPRAFQNCSNLTALYFLGNAPLSDTTIFDGAANVTNYYLPKTAGWGATYAGRPAVPVLFSYVTNAGTITLTRYIGIWGSVDIPLTIKGLPVTTLANSTFYQCGSLTNINVGSNITSIAGQAFVSCPNLLTITVDPLNPVYSSLDGVLFDKNRTTILYYPGGRTGSYTIPSGVTRIQTYAFQICPFLTTLTVPATVNSIGTLAFNGDPSLTGIYFMGNAPTADWDAFDIQNTVTVFYLPGTIGWDTNLGGLPTAVWRPQFLSSDANFGVRTNQFGFNVSWASGRFVVLDAATDLNNPVWVPIQTNFLATGSAYLSDTQWTNFPNRFYRLRAP